MYFSYVAYKKVHDKYSSHMMYMLHVAMISHM